MQEVVELGKALGLARCVLHPQEGPEELAGDDRGWQDSQPQQQALCDLQSGVDMSVLPLATRLDVTKRERSAGDLLHGSL